MSRRRLAESWSRRCGSKQTVDRSTHGLGTEERRVVAAEYRSRSCAEACGGNWFAKSGLSKRTALGRCVESSLEQEASETHKTSDEHDSLVTRTEINIER